MKFIKLRSTDELLNMSTDELIEYMKDYDSVVKANDSIKIVHFDHGVKILYYHRNESKPYKVQVYLNKSVDIDSLKK
jgi:hypothetical protein